MLSEKALSDRMFWLVASLELKQQTTLLLEPSKFYDDPVKNEERLRALVGLLALQAGMLPPPTKGAKPAWDDFIDLFQKVEDVAMEHNRVFELPEDVMIALSNFDAIAMTHMRLNKSEEWQTYDRAMAEVEPELETA